MRRFDGNSDRLFYIFTLTGIIVATIIITLARSFIFFSASISIDQQIKHIFNPKKINKLQLAMKASRNLHNTMFQGVTRARMYFFHTNPSGRILNRFSKGKY